MKGMYGYVKVWSTGATDEQLKRFVAAWYAKGQHELAMLADSELIYRELENEK